MPEKTLKESTCAKATVDEKVALARGRVAALKEFLSHGGTWEWRGSDCVVIEEALTALEERVKELEKGRDDNRLDYLEALYDRDGMFCESELYAEMVGLQNRKGAT